MTNYFWLAIPAAIVIACIYIPSTSPFPRPPPDWNGATGAAGSAPCPRLPPGSSWPSGPDGTARRNPAGGTGGGSAALKGPWPL
jgi:hypothetical protein